MRSKNIIFAVLASILFCSMFISLLTASPGDTSVILDENNIVTKNAEGYINVTGVNASQGNIWASNITASYWINASFLGGNYIYMGSLASDPVTPIQGQMWYNSAEDTMKYYNGTAIVIFPSIGGGSINGTYTLAYAYTIYKIGSTYYAEDDDGTIDSSSSNASIVINYALSHLTSGRNWMESIRLFGSFDIDGILIVYSYTWLDLRGARLELTKDQFAMFQNYGYGSTNVDYVTFQGGYLDGNKASRSQGYGIIGAFNEVIMEDVYIDSFSNAGIEIQSYSSAERAGGRFNLCYITENEGGGLMLSNNGYGTCDCMIEECYFINNNGNQIDIENNCHPHRIMDCHFASALQGTPYSRAISAVGDVRRIQVIGCHFEQIDKEAIYIEPGVTKYATNWIIQGNSFYEQTRIANNTYSYIQINCTVGGNCKTGTIMGNTFSSDDNRTTDNFAMYDIEFAGAGSDDWTVIGNLFEANTYWLAAIHNEGDSNIIAHNYNEDIDT